MAKTLGAKHDIVDKTHSPLHYMQADLFCLLTFHGGYGSCRIIYGQMLSWEEGVVV